jgi:Tol biopolymer transport system component
VIAVIQEDGSGLQLISDPAGNASNPAWYFDDTLLAYQSDLDGDSDIYIYDFASGLTRQLTDNGLADYAPTWMCGEPTVQFTSEVSGNADIFQADALPIDGEPLDITIDGQQLTSDASADRYSVGASTEENASREE